MKTVVFVVLACVCLLCLPMASFAVVVYENNYNSQTPGTGFPAWNWADNGICTHTATFADDGTGNIVVNHNGLIDNSLGTAAVDTRFGSQWGFTTAGNTSTNASDYTLEVDLRSLQGNWDPMQLEIWVLPGGSQGHGFATKSIYQQDGWDHFSLNLGDATKNWWNGTAWDLTSTSWTMEIGGSPWPGTSVPAGTPSWNQVWQMDNLKISMVPEPSTIIALLSLGGLVLLLRKRA